MMADHPTAWFEEQDCVRCGVRFGVPAGFTSNRRKDKNSFYCPNGHSMSYTESEADKMRRERDRLAQEKARVEEERDAAQRGEQRQRELRKAAERSAVAYRGVATRMKKRATKGTCPCCKTEFAELAAHMKDAHPDFNGRVRKPDLKVVGE